RRRGRDRQRWFGLWAAPVPREQPLQRQQERGGHADPVGGGGVREGGRPDQRGGPRAGPYSAAGGLPPAHSAHGRADDRGKPGGRSTAGRDPRAQGHCRQRTVPLLAESRKSNRRGAGGGWRIRSWVIARAWSVEKQGQVRRGRGKEAGPNKPLQQTGAALRSFVVYCPPSGPGC